MVLSCYSRTISQGSADGRTLGATTLALQTTPIAEPTHPTRGPQASWAHAGESVIGPQIEYDQGFSLYDRKSTWFS